MAYTLLSLEEELMSTRSKRIDKDFVKEFNEVFTEDISLKYRQDHGRQLSSLGLHFLALA